MARYDCRDDGGVAGDGEVAVKEAVFLCEMMEFWLIESAWPEGFVALLPMVACCPDAYSGVSGQA